MKPRINSRILSLCLLTSALSHQVVAQTSAFTYQGKLTDGPAPAAGLHDFQFKLYDAALGGAQQGTTVTVDDVSVAGGLFTVILDFGGGVFSGSGRWLEIGVRPGAATGAYTGLSPRQAVSSTPYAIRAAVASAVPAGSVTGSMLADGAVTASKLAPGAVSQLGASDGSPANAVQVNASGLVGVGTNAPAAGLHITASQNFFNPEQLALRVDETDGYTTLRFPYAVAVSGTLAAVASLGDAGITLLDIADPSRPNLRSEIRDGSGGYTSLGGAISVAMKPNLLAVAARDDNAVTLINVANPASPVMLAELKDGVGGWNELCGPQAVAINGNLMAIAAFDDSAVTLVDITNPAAPVKRSELKDGFFGFNNLTAATSVAFAGNLLAVGAYNDSAVTLIDVTDPSNPVKRAELKHGVGGYNALDLVNSVALAGNLLAIAAYGSDAVTLVNVSNPASPVKLIELRDNLNADSLRGAWGVALSGNQLAVAARDDNAVSMFDLSNPSNPVLLAVARHQIGGFNHLAAVRGLAFAGANLLVSAPNSHAVTMIQMANRPAGLSSQGWVGIGTTTPAGALHVVGDVYVEQAGRIGFNTRHFEAGVGNYAGGDFSTALGLGTAAQALGSTAMGVGTIASGQSSTSLGNSTIASGALSTAMGEATTASGFASTALGSNARAIHDGTFVWSDRQAGYFDSTAANQFAVRASGGVRFETGGAGLTVDGKQALLAPAAGQSLLLNPLSNDTSLSFGNQTRQMINLFDSTYAIGVQSDAAYFRTDAEFLWYRGGSHSDAFGDPGAGGTQLMRLGNSGNLVIAGTLSSGSDRNIKQGFAAVDPREVLDKVVALPLQSWTYKTDTGRRHFGPMAQDFHAAFGLNGDDDKHIATVDADGVALAAIKGLNEKVEEQDAALKERDARIAELEKRLSAIEAVLKR